MDWGPGECMEGDPRNRDDCGMLLMRYMVCSEGSEHSPAKARTPGTEAEIMGPYYPRGYYTTKQEFETQELHKDLG